MQQRVGQAQQAAVDGVQAVFAGGGDQYQPLHPLGMGSGVLGGQRAAEGVAHQHDFALRGESVQQGQQIGLDLVHGKRAGWTVGAAVAAQVHGDDPV